MSIRPTIYHAAVLIFRYFQAVLFLQPSYALALHTNNLCFNQLPKLCSRTFVHATSTANLGDDTRRDTSNFVRQNYLRIHMLHVDTSYYPE